MINKFRLFIRKVFNKKDIDNALKLLVSYQEGVVSSDNNKTVELYKIAELIKKYPELIIDKGLGYLVEFAHYYLPNYQTLDATDLPSRVITECLILNTEINGADQGKLLPTLAQNIAIGKARSLSVSKPKTAFVLTKNISLVINNDSSSIVKLKERVQKFLSISKNAEEFTNVLLDKYSPLFAVLGKDESLETIKQDMAIIIGHGSQQMAGQKNQAERYLELRAFELEVKSTVINYIHANTLGSSEAVEYLANNSIKAAEYLRSDYLTGMDRGLNPADIEKRLTKINKIINLIKKGQDTAVIGSKVIEKIREIVESHPSLSPKRTSIDDI